VRDFSTFEIAFELVIHGSVCNRVHTCGVTFLHHLLCDEIRVAMDLDACSTTGFFHMHVVTTSNLIQIRSARYVFHRNPRTVVAIYIT
jgi:hypothetical protein